MELIPAIDLLEGNCVRLVQGNYNKVTKFNSDPVSQALRWEDMGASRLHIVDLDAARQGFSSNDDVIKQIAKSLSIPIQIGGGIRTSKRAKELLDYGIDRVIIGTAALEDPRLVEDLASAFPKKIVLGIDAKEGKVATRGWIEQSDVRTEDLIKQFSNAKIAAIISTDISTDGTLEGPNLKSLTSVAKVSNAPVIASGGIGSLADLISLTTLEKAGVTGVIVGRALYDNKFSLEEAIKVLLNIDLQDQPFNAKNIA
ncbi:1-(5-phosphoribosyl)-5-[(5-phosphoribosylamino)methylideneamino]imidazole-4-carboxamide isomerase [Prochlorococcus marinus]|uniref:1-(5-phosphoribosyl)-5-[(5-phosphoribosylamino)methylideneamino] imidazole-4-carboxamide isomerase n=1 Tax=Prochlorococcus marinus (strain MIT 9211) TaxID=93059 RepID=HIS4_PROM4|nr:1-(5-phosphoribosyl)-5-[(5-phosphoribosylamino)methylideneamino]imidazole-4-carboxamide isomerase [Prochlorococcus marinus]A9BAN4.1 RecName: Full=1-(5-phosphoribosyl)-5-[(5-phosphoribosylamino)methylideneamino] imidazole-4-carboxamide isomerase; AltName: Full=Phosphoribosylformimino-5-aminoimidazole carboxamide ribotide isomerase [Prochlorococcus marinus str. MIT 9211]ABX08896.1 Phosphoribosylformimino-5-aminoimidazole carboxamide ribotide isomerase [Prochlorococcus marinus str. MIT 9211]